MKKNIIQILFATSSAFFLSTSYGFDLRSVTGDLIRQIPQQNNRGNNTSYKQSDSDAPRQISPRSSAFTGGTKVNLFDAINQVNESILQQANKNADGKFLSVEPADSTHIFNSTTNCFHFSSATLSKIYEFYLFDFRSEVHRDTSFYKNAMSDETERILRNTQGEEGNAGVDGCKKDIEQAEVGAKNLINRLQAIGEEKRIIKEKARLAMEEQERIKVLAKIEREEKERLAQEKQKADQQQRADESAKQRKEDELKKAELVRKEKQRKADRYAALKSGKAKIEGFEDVDLLYAPNPMGACLITHPAVVPDRKLYYLISLLSESTDERILLGKDSRNGYAYVNTKGFKIKGLRYNAPVMVVGHYVGNTKVTLTNNSSIPAAIFDLVYGEAIGEQQFGFFLGKMTLDLQTMQLATLATEKVEEYDKYEYTFRYFEILSKMDKTAKIKTIQELNLACQ